MRVHVQPGAKQNRVEGWRPDGSLKVRVTAPAERGRANAAVRDLLARHFRVAPTSIVLVRGGSSRDKLVDICGL
jgi:uncharacterized protein (TIGR00251 family)